MLSWEKSAEKKTNKSDKLQTSDAFWRSVNNFMSASSLQWYCLFVTTPEIPLPRNGCFVTGGRADGLKDRQTHRLTEM